MAKLRLEGNASGTGVITLTAPNTDVDRTITLPDSAGSLLDTTSTLDATKLSGDLPAIDGGALTGVGKVLQVVNLVYSTQSSMTIGNTDTAITGMNLSITPVGAGSRFRIDARLFGENGDSWNTVYNIHRDGARVNTTSSLNYHGLSVATQSYPVASDNNSTPDIMHLSTVDSTGSAVGTSITYTLVGSHSTSVTQWINRCFGTPTSGYETGISEIIITEIGA
tara:strand:- start:822 stop:1490 length:669 start_codon:yes stop_codon:yes gene_type:complete